MPDFDSTTDTPAARLAARCGSDTLRLEPEWPAILAWMRQFGRVVARFENRHASIATPGRFSQPLSDPSGRVFLGGDIPLVCRLERWRTIFATIDDAGRRALCLFDVCGDAVATIEIDDPAGRSAFDEMVWRLHAFDQSTVESGGGTMTALARADRERLLRCAGSNRAREVGVTFVRGLLARLGAHGGDVTCALGNAGATHVHGGALERFEGIARWTASFASRATLSIDASAIARAWIVEPARPGERRTIELFGKRGEPIVTLACRFSYAGT